ncbi:MAG: DUF2892 domain-containing protein [Nitrospiraceae bacterium]|nr:DUF2892 domain-containing protein [Nitrospiraceae bacterium]
MKNVGGKDKILRAIIGTVLILVGAFAGLAEALMVLFVVLGVIALGTAITGF